MMEADKNGWFDISSVPEDTAVDLWARADNADGGIVLTSYLKSRRFTGCERRTVHVKSEVGILIAKVYWVSVNGLNVVPTHWRPVPLPPISSV